MIEKLLPIANIKKFEFSRKPVSLPADLRPMWKISQMLLILKICSRKERATILKLQVFNWATKSLENRKQLVAYIDKEKSAAIFLHLDPSINRAVEFGIGEDFVDLDNKGYVCLADKGGALAQMIIEDKELFSIEKEFFYSLGKKVSEAKIKRILKN